MVSETIGTEEGIIVITATIVLERLLLMMMRNWLGIRNFNLNLMHPKAVCGRQKIYSSR
jgi:hypothetical protein